MKKIIEGLNIEAGIEIPPPGIGTGNSISSKYRKVAGEMAVGDSIGFDNEKDWSRFAGGLNHIAKKDKNCKFATRKLPDGTFRIWRIK